ncbi:MAG: penicillin-binding transpeptidase domain-containing protein, partial [candidate division Zixibacteria bacterium]|nr:penicillin-binding transpeptidase domain-containing protein [candidate division Zixibacteria bacterium]
MSHLEMQRYYIDRESRGKIGGIVVAIVMAIIIAALLYHQVIFYKTFLKQSESNRIRIRPIIPKRGVIYDRNLQMMADNRLSFTVSLVPCEVVKSVTIPRLSQLLGIDTIEIKQRAAVTYSVESVRRYVEGISSETFIGYIGEVSPEEVDVESPMGYRPGRLIGKKGIEKAYDEELRGLEGTDYIEVSAQGVIVGPYEMKDKVPAIPGSDLVLTIDANLQQFIVKYFDSLQYCGAVVAIDPNNGEILALASFPGLDPNIFSGIIPANLWQTIVDDSNHPLLNRPLTGLYPPGSTAKLFTAGAALERGAITEGTLLRPCFGGMQFGNRFFKCWDPRGHGRLDVYHAVEQSCDVFFYQTGQLLGLDDWSQLAIKSGFGKKTGIDIAGELAGIIPSASYYDKVYGKRGWSKLLIVNLAIGQGEFTITPLQLAQFYCGLANGGKIFRPHLLREIRRADGSMEKMRPQIVLQLPFSKANMTILQRALEMVVQGDRGTAQGIRNKNYS